MTMNAAWGTERIERRRITRSQYVEDLLNLLYPDLRKPLRECRLLDLGSGLGTISIPAARIVRSVLGIDIEPDYVRKAQEGAEREGLENAVFRVGSAIDVDEGLFDIVLCDYVLEHVEEPGTLVSAISRSLAPEGAYYLSTNNRWWPLEGHYGLPLPFLPWLPRSLADRYVRLMKFGDRYDIFPISWKELRLLLSHYGLTWSPKTPVRPYTFAQKVGKRLVSLSPAFWNVANAFQVVGRRREPST
jgi:SAM-dependent methyltransferase